MATQENMVLRTIYLPKSLDQKLRSMAFQAEQPKGELMRALILEALSAREAKAAPAPRAKVKPTSKSKLEVVAVNVPAPRRTRGTASKPERVLEDA
jgi:hypothetical protein